MPQPSHRTPSAAVTVVTAAGDQLDARTLHDLLRLRVDVFVVEQACPYPEIDGLDLRSDTRHLWIDGTPDAPVAASLRILTEPDGSQYQRRIGRVVTHADARGRGHASRLMEEALAQIGSKSVTLDAQTYLVDFYVDRGFTPIGPEFVEDGIPHVPMARRPETHQNPSPTHTSVLPGEPS